MTNDLQVNVITQRINEITTPIAVAVFHYDARKVTMYTKPGKLFIICLVHHCCRSSPHSPILPEITILLLSTITGSRTL